MRGGKQSVIQNMRKSFWAFVILANRGPWHFPRVTKIYAGKCFYKHEYLTVNAYLSLNEERTLLIFYFYFWLINGRRK